MSRENYTEADYAKVVVDHFESLNYDVYKEVGFGGGSKRVDILCKNGDEIVAIEVKKSLNLKVIDQAYNWREFANKSYIAVPLRAFLNYDIIRTICEQLGIGLFVIRIPKNHREFPTLSERIPPCVNKNPDDLIVYEEQKGSVAGNNNGDYITPFKITCKRLVEHVINNGPVTLVDAINSIDHHYSNAKSATANIRKMIDLGVIKELEIYRDGKYLYIKSVK